MLIVMKKDAEDQHVEKVVQTIANIGLTPHKIPGAQRVAVGITGNTRAVDSFAFEILPGVEEVIRVSKPYKLVSREFKPENTVVSVGNFGTIGAGELTLIAGPCAVESREQTFAVAKVVADCGLRLLRGGAYKPRTSPYSFQGLGEEGLQILQDARELYGVGIVTEAVDERSLELIAKYADVIQIGARNMQNFRLLQQAGQVGKPVMLKRGMSASFEELLLAAEYILSEGNYQVILCERGIRTFSDHTRNTLDLAVVPAVKKASHLPIMVDPSHGTGQRDKVIPMARAAIAAGADGVIVEVHCQPERALSDGPQALLPTMLAEMVEQLREIHQIVARFTNPVTV
jgi:3-deoxy-7-phosphoheptulonate synthase